MKTNQVLLGHRTVEAGWVIDAALTNTSLDYSTDNTLGVFLKDTGVSVTVNDEAALSYAFNALITDGNFGLLARNGLTSFDEVNVKKDDPQYTQPALPAVSVSDAFVKEGNSGAVTTTLTVSLSRAAAEAVAVDYRTVNGTAMAGSDYQAATGTVTFALGETSKMIELTVLGDLALEPKESSNEFVTI